jgi:hypothetical protein
VARRAERRGPLQRGGAPPGGVGNNQGARPGQRLQTGGEVWGFADDTSLLRGAGTNKIANDDEAAGDADPNVQRLGRGDPADRVDDREPGASRALGIVFVRLGIAEINQHAIAHILGDKTAKAADGVGHAAMVGADDLAQILRIEACRQRCRTDQITEHHRQLPPLGLGRGCAAGGRHRPADALAGLGLWFLDMFVAKRGDRIEQPPAIPDQSDAQVLQILHGEARQYVSLDPVLAKSLVVPLEPEGPQPFGHVHWSRPKPANRRHHYNLSAGFCPG